MLNGSSRYYAATLLLALAPILAAPLASQDIPLSKLLESNADAVITVQFVIQVKMSGTLGGLMGEAQEYETEAVCVVIDPKGLVLCSNTQLGGFTDVMARVMGRMGADSDVAATPTQIRTLVAGEAKPLPARLLVRDTDLDLAWLQIDAGADRRFSYIDFAKGAKPEVGAPVFALRRLDKFFDRSPSLLEGRIGGVTSKPRTLYIPTGSIETNLGLPILTPRGEAVGILILQLPEEGGAPSGGRVSLEMMGWSSRMQSISRGVILPASEVVKATQRATASLGTGAAGR
jgi:hypothetical protein